MKKTSKKKEKRKKKKHSKKKQNELIVKPDYKHRVPHRPTKVHRNRKKYTRKGKIKDIQRKETEQEEEKN